MNNISNIITASYKTSREADQISQGLKKALGCEANYEIARLALGRSLGLENTPESAPDSNGSPLKGLQLFGKEEDGNYLWIALLGEQLKLYGQPKFTLEALQKLVRDHWHRGVQLLQEDWQKAEGDFAKFLDELAHRANLPESRQIGELPTIVTSSNSKNPATKEDCDHLFKELRKVGITVEIRSSVIGSRLTRYRLFLPNASDYAVLEKKLDQLGFALGLGVEKLVLTKAAEPQTCDLDRPRRTEEWLPVGISDFDRAVQAFSLMNMSLPVSPGVDLEGQPIIFDLANAPHLLVAGTTGSGKSVCVNALLLSLIYVAKQKPVKLALIDPKQVEFSQWRNCGCLYAEIATSAADAISLLDELVVEMEARYAQFELLGVKNLHEARERGFEGGWIVVAVDELADLITQDKVTEDRLVQLASKARAAGIHLILATQRPDAKTFSGLLRSNCPARIALKVQRSTESSIILDETGAESLLGKGDMLIKGVIPLTRAHGYKIESDDITKRLRSSL
ncbi:MAG: FtsK/SpoIIIE domain-containing protein [Gallionella sp.]|nr:FtsK/SpoIIIE domain-containing protein [Gallionella sp.]